MFKSGISKVVLWQAIFKTDVVSILQYICLLGDSTSNTENVKEMYFLFPT